MQALLSAMKEVEAVAVAGVERRRCGGQGLVMADG
jgi:hypothetical protein